MKTKRSTGFVKGAEGEQRCGHKIGARWLLATVGCEQKYAGRQQQWHHEQNNSNGTAAVVFLGGCVSLPHFWGAFLRAVDAMFVCCVCVFFFNSHRFFGVACDTVDTVFFSQPTAPSSPKHARVTRCCWSGLWGIAREVHKLNEKVQGSGVHVLPCPLLPALVSRRWRHGRF